MNGTNNRIRAGVSVPDTNATPIVQPVVRSWLFAARLGQLSHIDHDAEVVAVGTLLHDITLNERFDGPRRFEVEGADLARAFSRQGGVDECQAQLNWDSVALNSTSSIGLYKEAELALCTAGVCLDLNYDTVLAAEIALIVGEFPRLDMKRRMTRCFCHIAQTHPEATYDTFARDYGERFVPGYRAPSSVVANAPFKE